MWSLLSGMPPEEGQPQSLAQQPLWRPHGAQWAPHGAPWGPMGPMGPLGPKGLYGKLPINHLRWRYVIILSRAGICFGQVHMALSSKLGPRLRRGWQNIGGGPLGPLGPTRGPLGPLGSPWAPWAPLGSGVGDRFPDLRVPTGFRLRDRVGDHFPDLRVPSGFGLRDWGGGPFSCP